MWKWRISRRSYYFGRQGKAREAREETQNFKMRRRTIFYEHVLTSFLCIWPLLLHPTQSFNPQNNAEYASSPPTLHNMVSLVRPITAATTADPPLHNRRIFLGRHFLQWLSGPAVLATFPTQVHAIFESTDRRQLEFCLVAVLRVTYFAQNLVFELKSAGSEEERRKRYLEARLGAKAALTGKIGGGATGRVFTLSSLQLTGCLNDMDYYSKNPFTISLRQDFREALASLVEFDGLDTLTDDSPRSSLTLQQYTNQKASFVERVLSERVIPFGQRLVQGFDASAVERARTYVQRYYSDEIPAPQDEDKIVSG